MTSIEYDRFAASLKARTLADLQISLGNPFINFDDVLVYACYRSEIEVSIRSKNAEDHVRALLLISNILQKSRTKFLKDGWKDFLLLSAGLQRERILDQLLNEADNASLGKLMLEPQMQSIPVARKLIARGVDLHQFKVEEKSIYGWMIDRFTFSLASSEANNIRMQSILTFVSFLKNELKVIPNVGTVLNDLKEIASNGDHALDLLVAVYEFPHDDSTLIDKKNMCTGAITLGTPWYFDIVQRVCSRGGVQSFNLLKFLHNKKIPLDSIENDEQQNLLHLLFINRFKAAILDSRRSGCAGNFNDIVSFLIQVGVDPNKKDKSGKLPFDYAMESDIWSWVKKPEEDKIREILASPSNKEIVFKLDIMPVPPHESSSVVSFSPQAAQLLNPSGQSTSVHQQGRDKTCTLL